MQNHDWSRFRLHIPVKTDPATIYRHWTTPEGLESWFLRKAAFTGTDGILRPGNAIIEVNDSYEWLWHGWSDDVVEKGEILNMEVNFLSFSFGRAGNVDVRIRQERKEPVVELFQYGMPTDEASIVSYHVGCTKGWLFYLTNLKSVLEGGIDLRNKNVELEDVINA